MEYILLLWNFNVYYIMYTRISIIIKENILIHKYFHKLINSLRYNDITIYLIFIITKLRRTVIG